MYAAELQVQGHQITICNTEKQYVGILIISVSAHFLSIQSILITPHAQRERGKVSVVVSIYYIIIYVCGRKKYLNRTLEIDSPFQTFAVGLLVEFID